MRTFTFGRDLDECKRAWRAFRPPTYPHEFDSAISLVEDNGKDGRFSIVVTWNPVKEWYEAEPIERHYDGTLHITTLQLRPEVLESIKAELASYGVTELLRLYRLGETDPAEEPPTTLPKTLFPTVVTINRTKGGGE